MEQKHTTANKHATDGMAEDLIRSFVQTAAYELHLKTLLEKRHSELENGKINVEDEEVVSNQIEQIEHTEKLLDEVAQIRRDDMLFLYSLYNASGDKERWCNVKHTAMMIITAFEAWQASDGNPELEMMYLNKNRLFIRELSAFLGVGITECAACFSDMLKGKEPEAPEEKGNTTETIPLDRPFAVPDFHIRNIFKKK